MATAIDAKVAEEMRGREEMQYTKAIMNLLITHQHEPNSAEDHASENR